MKKLLKYIAIACVVMLTARCSDDFLDVSNPNEIDAGVFFQSMGDLELALTGVYSAHKSFELYGADFLVKALYGMPHTADQDWLGHNVWNQLYRNEVTPDNGLVSNFWRAWYRAVARANDFLTNADVFLENNEISQDEIDQVNSMKAQAHFLRAFDYFHLIRLWGEKGPAQDAAAKGVPLILDIATSRDAMSVPRSTVGDVYEQIIADLEAAEAGLPDTWDASNIARVDKYAAKGYLGKVYLYMENYPMAKQYFEEVINSNEFTLVPFEEYNGLFHGENEFSDESLFELNFSEDLQENTWAGGTGTNIALMLAPKGTGWSNVYPHDENIKRFGNDPRLRINALEPMVDSVVTGSGEKIALPVYVDDEGALGWSFKKYIPTDYSVYSTNRTYGANILLMRLADIYLMYAEVLNAEGDDAMAAEYMNKVRRRAYGFDPDVAEPSVDYTGLAGSQLRDSIREERFRELFAEGHRWYDIVRWGIVEEEVNKYEKVRSGEIIYNARDYYLPIPIREMEANTVIVQSDGY